MRLILARHGETAWNREGRNQGRSTTGLNAEGLRQARNLAQSLRKIPISAVYSSPLSRAMQTAQAVGQTLSLPVTPLDGLMEMDLGSLDGLTNLEMHRNFPHLLDLWRKDPSSMQMPGGESLKDAQQRAWRTLEDIRQETREGHAVAVTHNFVIGVIVLRALGLPLSAFQRIRIELGSFTTLEHVRNRWQLISLNETLHQRGE